VVISNRNRKGVKTKRLKNRLQKTATNIERERERWNKNKETQKFGKTERKK
jgi:hypothetical protein